MAGASWISASSVSAATMNREDQDPILARIATQRTQTLVYLDLQLVS